MNNSQNKPKVMFLSDVDYFKGGAERSIFDAMATPAITPILAVPNMGALSNHAKALNIPSVTLDYGAVAHIRRPFHFTAIFACIIDAFKSALALKSLAKSNAATAIHSNGLKAHGIACLARILGGVPVSVHYRAIPYTLAEKAFWRFTQIIARHVVLVSRPCWPWKNMPKNVQVIFNGINPLDPAILPPRSIPGQIPRSPFVLGFVGRIHHSKGLHDLIEWFGELRAQGLDIRLSIRGAAAPDDKPYEAQIKHRIAEKSLTDYITFTGQKSDYREIYADIDANIVSSTTPDPLPRSVMEASALGIPVLGYPAGGIPDMIDDGVNGFLFRDAAQLAPLIKRLQSDPDFYDQISRAAMINAKQRFSMQSLHDAIAALYRAV